MGSATNISTAYRTEEREEKTISTWLVVMGKMRRRRQKGKPRLRGRMTRTRKIKEERRRDSNLQHRLKKKWNGRFLAVLVELRNQRISRENRDELVENWRLLPGLLCIPGWVLHVDAPRLLPDTQ